MTDRDQPTWRSYEDVAIYLLNEMAASFNVGHVEGKQFVPGKSGTTWEIDGKAVRDGSGGFLLVECRRRARGATQEEVAALAYRIDDTGAAGGFLVSPIAPQEGAKIVARHERIQHLQLREDSTTTEYVMRFLNQVFVGLHAKQSSTATLSTRVIRAGDRQPE